MPLTHPGVQMEVVAGVVDSALQEIAPAVRVGADHAIVPHVGGGFAAGQGGGVDTDRPSGACHVQSHQRVATDAARVRVDDALNKGRGDGGVDGVATGKEDARRRLPRRWVGALRSRLTWRLT